MSALCSPVALLTHRNVIAALSLLLSMCASVMYKWGMWELFSDLFIYFKDQVADKLQLSALKQYAVT